MGKYESDTIVGAFDRLQQSKNRDALFDVKIDALYAKINSLNTLEKPPFDEIEALLEQIGELEEIRDREDEFDEPQCMSRDDVISLVQSAQSV